MGQWSDEAIKNRGDRLAPLITAAQTFESEQLAAQYKEDQAAKDALEAQISDINLRLEALRLVFTDRFAELDVTKVTFENGITVSATIETGLKVTGPLDFLTWLKSTGQEGELRVPANSVGRIVREARDAKLFEGELPPGVSESEPFIKFKCK